MAQVSKRQDLAFIALQTTGRAKTKGQNDAALPCRVVAWLALRSLASVAFCAASNQAVAEYQTFTPSTRGHFYFGEMGDISILG
jgi:hypothetical protein